MPDIWVSVDVETTGPFPGMGELCSIGAVAYHGDTLEELDQLYIRVDPASRFDKLLVPRGFTRQQALDSWLWGGDTRQWWEQQEAEVLAEALYPDRPRMSFPVAGRTLHDWLRGLPGKPVFVAHPAGFDWAWINYLLLANHLLPGMSVMEANPFGYRPACLRALSWAQGDGTEWSVDRASLPEFHHESEVPHHALHDAIAQGKTMVKVLQAIRVRSLGVPPPAEDLTAEDRKVIEEILAEANRQVPDAAPAAAD